MPVNTYYAGTLVRVATYTGLIASPTGGFRDNTGTLADPVLVVLQYRTSENGPLTTITTPDSRIVHDATGLFHADLDTTGSAEALWTYAWSGAGGLQAVSPPGNFQVRPLFS